MKSRVLITSVSSLLIGISAFLFYNPKLVNAQACSGYSYYATNCKVSSTGDCTADPSSIVAKSCYIDSKNSCVASIGNQICGYYNGTCKLIIGSPSTITIPCGGSGTAPTNPPSQPNPTYPSTGPTPTSPPGMPPGTICREECTVSWDCKRADSCGKANQGAYCGQTKTDNTPKYMCKTTSCVQVCTTPTPKPLTPTPTKLPAPTPLTPIGSTTAACFNENPGPVTFSWTSVPGASSYSLRIDDLSNSWINCSSTTNPNPGDFCIDNILNTSHVVYLPPNKNYTWYVQAKSSNNESAVSPKMQFTSPAMCVKAMCQILQAYNVNWVLMTMDNLKNTKAGDKIYYCASGSATGGYFDKARFTINGVLMPETTFVKPGTNDYCQAYQVPPNTYKFDISAELHHVTLGWVL